MSIGLVFLAAGFLARGADGRYRQAWSDGLDGQSARP